MRRLKQDASEPCIHGIATDCPECEEVLEAWPNCVTADCENKCCTWSGTAYCSPCAERRIGRDEMIRRFNATHEITWDEAIRLEAEEDATDADRD